MSFNFYRRLRSLLPDAPLLVGQVTAFTPAGYIVQLPDGSEIVARGETTVGQCVFVRAGLIEGSAPLLPTVIIEI